jgi:hypothetical protein
MVNHKGSCTVCRHTQSRAIDEALVVGVSVRSLSKRYGLARSSIQRHQAHHIPQTLAKAAERAAERREDGLLGSFEGLVADAHRLKRKAEAAKDYSTALAGIREITRLLELAFVHQPKVIEPKVRVRLEFTVRGPRTVIERAEEETPPIETTAVPALPEEPPQAVKTKPTEPATAKPPADLGGFPVKRAESQAAEERDRYSREERDRRLRAAEEAADAAEDQENEDARRGIGPGKWGAF